MPYRHRFFPWYRPSALPSFLLWNGAFRAAILRHQWNTNCYHCIDIRCSNQVWTLFAEQAIRIIRIGCLSYLVQYDGTACACAQFLCGVRRHRDKAGQRKRWMKLLWPKGSRDSCSNENITSVFSQRGGCVFKLAERKSRPLFVHTWSFDVQERWKSSDKEHASMQSRYYIRSNCLPIFGLTRVTA